MYAIGYGTRIEGKLNVMSEEFREEVLQFWTEAIRDVAGNNPPVTATWRGANSVHDVLQPFMASNRNHAHIPSGGGLDALGVNNSAEVDCLDIAVGTRSAWILKPESLILEYIPESPIDSFLLLELARLEPSGVYGHRESGRAMFSEELAELSPRMYVDRAVMDAGYVGHDENGREIPLPHETRLVTRWFRGKILIVAKRSIWNGNPQTYDGRHNTMTSAEIKSLITEVVRGRN